jgi:hypothetical protein
MRRMMWFALLVCFVMLLTEAPAQAYLDPGTGSMVFQVLLGGFAAIGVFVKLFWHSLTDRFRRRPPDGRK